MPNPEASYPTEMCPTCGKYPALRGRSCFVCFTGAVVGDDGSLLKPQVNNLTPKQGGIND